ALAARGAGVVGLDVTLRMIELAVAKHNKRSPERLALPTHASSGEGARGFQPSVNFLVGDMLALPFPPASFDIVTTGYGLRNVPDLRWRRARVDAASRSGHLPVHSSVHPPVSRRRRGGAALRDPRVPRPLPCGPRRVDGHTSCRSNLIRPRGRARGPSRSW